MEEVKNLDQKRVCDISPDRKTILIHKKGCTTKIFANTDGTLSVEQDRDEAAV